MEIPTRADVPETDKWDLTHLFADVSKWQEDFAWMQREYPKLEQWRGRVGESAQTLAGLLEFEKTLEEKMERVYHYASLQAAEDSTNNEYPHSHWSGSESTYKHQRGGGVCCSGNFGDR